MLRKISILLQRFHLDGHRKEALACHYHKTFDNIFVVKLFFMPDVLSQKAAGGSKADYISSRMTGAD